MKNKHSSYKGIWEKDKLNEKAKISFSDGSLYDGNVEEFDYNGEGVYKFPNMAQMKCEFVNNIPVNDVLLTDPTGNSSCIYIKLIYSMGQQPSKSFDRSLRRVSLPDSISVTLIFY